MPYKTRRLPNGFGQISKLSGNRTRPYMVRTTDREIIGYSETYEDAYLLLCEYNKTPWNVEQKKSTLEDVWEIFKETEFERFSENTKKRFISRYKHLKPIADKEYASFKTFHFMRFLNNLDVSENIRNQIIALLKHLDDVAYQLDIIDKKYAYELKGKSFERKSKRKPFSEEEIDILWNHIDEDFVDYILIAIYTGFRANELISLTIENIDFEQWVITAGSKTKAGKNRVVPVHERIRPLVKKIFETSEANKFYKYTYQKFKDQFKKTTQRILGRSFIPHEARHTLRTRLDNVGANKVAIDRILGHKSGDTGMDIYTHKTIKQLHEAIALLK